MSDNFHQSVLGGTGANHIMLGHGDAIWFSDGSGNAATPPHNMLVAQGSANAGIVDEVENPNPTPGTNNWYSEDGYGAGSFGAASSGGGSYTNWSDTTQPGVQPIGALPICSHLSWQERQLPADNRNRWPTSKRSAAFAPPRST